MPCLEVVMPATNTEIKKDLAVNLTRAFADASGFPGEIFGIHFQEYDADQAASGGILCQTESEERPYLHFLLYSPRLSRTVKQKLVASLTQVFSECLGKPEWKPVIHLMEHPYDNVGVNGQLLSDAYEELGESKFYYELPRD